MISTVCLSLLICLLHPLIFCGLLLCIFYLLSYSSALIDSVLKFLLFVEVLTVFLHSFPNFSDNLYDCYFEVFIRKITCLCFISFLITPGV